MLLICDVEEWSILTQEPPVLLEMGMSKCISHNAHANRTAREDRMVHPSQNVAEKCCFFPDGRAGRISRMARRGMIMSCIDIWMFIV